MSPTTVIRVHSVSKRFTLHKDTSLKERFLHLGRSTGSESFWALRDIDLDIGTGETVGLIGSNGSGKSTLLKIIGAILDPTTGTVARRGRLAALLELGAGFHQDLTGRENVFLNASILGLSRRETERRLDEIIEFSGIEDFIDNQVKFYSSGMYVRLAFAVAVHVDPDVLLVDEVLAVGDEPFQRKCMDRIREFQSDGRTIVLVSHSADQVGDLCDRAVLLRKGEMLYDGRPADALRQLRAGFEQSRLEHVAGPSGDGHPSGARVTGVELLSGDGSPTDTVATGDDVTIRVHVDPATGLDEWLTALSLETTLGHSLFRFNTQTAGLSLKPITSPAEVDFVLPRLPLGEGTYLINVGIGRPTGQTIHRVAAAATLNVSGPFTGTGALGIRPTVTVR